jgi:hypothetical protein
MNADNRDERLRRLLRETDLAQTESGLTLEEIHEMRRAVLTAIPEPRRRFALLPGLAGAAMVALAVIAVLMMWPRSESTTPPPSAPPRIAVEEPATEGKRTDTRKEVDRPDPRPSLKARATDGSPSGTTKALVVAGPAGDTVDSPAASAPGEQIAVSNESETETRQIQFDTPGGTRVIWILTANDDAL